MRGRAGRQDEVGGEALLVEIADTLVEPPEPVQVRRIGGLVGAARTFGDGQAAQVVELLGRAGIRHGAEIGIAEGGETQFRGAHPEVRQVALGVGPVAHFSRLDETRRIRKPRR